MLQRAEDLRRCKGRPDQSPEETRCLSPVSRQGRTAAARRNGMRNCLLAPVPAPGTRMAAAKRVTAVFARIDLRELCAKEEYLR
jgi:hypothetical protein